MKELFLENFFFLFYILTWIVSVLTYKKYFDTPLKFFPIYVAYVIFTELLGYFILNFEEFSFFSEEEYSWHNIIIFNVYQLIMLSFFFWLYLKFIHKKAHRKYVIIAIIITALSYLVSLFFQNPLHSSLYYADIMASFTLILCIALYFKERKWEGKLDTLQYSLMFWISLGLLIFHLIVPFLFLVGYVNYEVWKVYHFRQILWVLISVMYSLFTIGLIVSKRRAFR